MAEEVKRIVTIISGDKRYAKSPYRSIAMYRDDIGTYITGQHIDPYDESTVGNLTPEQMMDISKMTTEQLKKFDYVINPEKSIPIRHGLKLDVSVRPDGTRVNPKDYWIYNYILLQTIVAKSKSEFDKTIHRFYIEDKELESETRVNKRDKMLKAFELVRTNMSLEKLINVAIMLNYYIKEFNVDIDKVSKIVLEDEVYIACEKHPEDVIKCFEGDWKDNLYILSLAHKGIITRKGDDFYDGGIYVGKGLDGVKAFMAKSDNRATINKWSSLYKGDNVYIADKLNTKNKSLEVLSEGLLALSSNDESGVNYAKEKLSELGETDLLEKLLNAIESSNKSKKEDTKKKSSDDISDENKMKGLRMMAGRMKLPKEEWDELNLKELEAYIHKKKSENQ